MQKLNLKLQKLWRDDWASKLNSRLNSCHQGHQVSHRSLIGRGLCYPYLGGAWGIQMFFTIPPPPPHHTHSLLRIKMKIKISIAVVAVYHFWGLCVNCPPNQFFLTPTTHTTRIFRPNTVYGDCIGTKFIEEWRHLPIS